MLTCTLCAQLLGCGFDFNSLTGTSLDIQANHSFPSSVPIFLAAETNKSGLQILVYHQVIVHASGHSGLISLTTFMCVANYFSSGPIYLVLVPAHSAKDVNKKRRGVKQILICTLEEARGEQEEQDDETRDSLLLCLQTRFASVAATDVAWMRRALLKLPVASSWFHLSIQMQGILREPDVVINFRSSLLFRKNIYKKKKKK